MRFTKIGCNNVTKCIIPPWVVGWNNVGKIQPAINVAAGVAHLAQSRPATKSWEKLATTSASVPSRERQHGWISRPNYSIHGKYKSFFLLFPSPQWSVSVFTWTSSNLSFFFDPVLLRQLIASASMSVRCNCFYPQHSSHSHADPILLGFRKTSNNLNSTDTHQSFVLLQYACAACLTSELQHIVCPLTSLSEFFLSPMSVTSLMIPPGRPLLSWVSMGQVFMFQISTFYKMPSTGQTGISNVC